jgi:hypothetical protein
MDRDRLLPSDLERAGLAEARPAFLLEIMEISEDSLLKKKVMKGGYCLF